MRTSNFPDFLTEPVDAAAQKLLGCILERTVDGRTIRVRIVETEAYDQEDEASHTYIGQTLRNATMFGGAGHLYVYFTYGMHHCCNIVTGRAGHGSGVLIRAVEPLNHRDYIEAKRGVSGANATNGPGKVAQALGIDRRLDGHDLRTVPLKLFTEHLRPGETISSSPRIGISKAQEIHRRYFIAGNAYVTRHAMVTSTCYN